MDLKQLKKIAAACRKAGIKHYKCQEFEFTLSDDLPTTPSTVSKKSQGYVEQGKVESDEPSPEELMFWSSDAQITENQDEARLHE